MTTETRSAQGPDSARALATVDPNAQALQAAEASNVAGGHLLVTRGADNEDHTLERIEANIRLPAAFQYAIPVKGIKNADGSWNNDAAKVGITSDGYDYLNRVIGCTFFFPEMVHDENDHLRHNPIHRPDYIYMRIGGVWRNPVGQLVMAIEDVEVDFKLMYQNKRANSVGATMVMGDNGPLWDEAGNAVLKLSQEAELKAYKELTQNRSFGPRYAITVGRIRILKMATGLRSMPTDRVVDGAIVKVVGFRDLMTPQERVEAAGGDAMSAMYGRPTDIKPLTAEEAAQVRLDNDLDAEEAAERAAVAAAAAVDSVAETPTPETPSADPARVWTAEELAGIE